MQVFVGGNLNKNLKPSLALVFKCAGSISSTLLKSLFFQFHSKVRVQSNGISKFTGDAQLQPNANKPINACAAPLCTHASTASFTVQATTSSGTCNNTKSATQIQSGNPFNFKNNPVKYCKSTHQEKLLNHIALLGKRAVDAEISRVSRQLNATDA